MDVYRIKDGTVINVESWSGDLGEQPDGSTLVEVMAGRSARIGASADAPYMDPDEANMKTIAAEWEKHLEETSYPVDVEYDAAIDEAFDE